MADPPGADDTTARGHAPRWSGWRVGVWLFLGLIFLYNADLTETTSGDTVASVHTAWNLVRYGSIHLDRLAWDLLGTPMGYAISKQGHHWVSNYPILPALLAVPIMAAFDTLGILYEDTAFAAGKLTASILVALSAVLLWSALRSRTTPRRALLFALVYGMATCGWSMSAQSLWQHATSQFFGAWIVYLLAARGEDRRSLKWLGLAAALLVAGRPADLAVALLLALHVLVRWRLAAWRFALPAAAVALAFLAYNAALFGNLLGGYAVLNGPDAAGYFHHRGLALLHNLAAILVSPNRGLFVFSPVLLFAAWGIGRFLRHGRARLLAPEAFFAAAAAVLVLQTASYGWWDGGHCYGYRLLTDLLPYLCFFLAWLPADPRCRRTIAGVFSVLLAWSVFVQYVGAFHYPRGGWNSGPVNIIDDRSRVWDLRDPQILRELKAPPKMKLLRFLARQISPGG